MLSLRPSRLLAAVVASAWVATAAMAAGALVAPPAARADSSTVSYDTLRTGWDPNEPNLSPDDVSSPDFGQLFATQLDGQVAAQPVVSRSTVLAVTENNTAYGLNPVSGAIVWSRHVGAAWPASVLGCGDLVPTIGITGTPVVDPASGTAYFTAKVDDGPDQLNPHWYMHAVDVTSGAERPGFPTVIQGSPSNAPGLTFTPRTAMQRPGLLLLDGVVYAAFASHCDVQPYVGYVVGVDATSGRQTAMWAAATGSASAGGGIWQSGGGLVSDGPGRMFFSTGNGLSPPPAPGSQPPGNLSESVVRLQVNSDGSLVSKDFFSPYNNTNLDRDDNDLGAGGPMGLPDALGTPSHPHVLVQAGKDGRVFLLDRDHLGGSAQGPGSSDAVLQTLGPYSGVWGHPGLWGGDGGYVYLVPNQSPLTAFKVGATGDGTPTLARVGTSSGFFGYTSGSPVVTSSGTTSGSALVWAVYSAGSNGSGGQLRAYDAVPQNGTMTLRYAAPIGTATKFSVPGTDQGRVYVGSRDGVLLGFGRPTTAALQGSPTDFGSVAVGTSVTRSVTVTALRTLTVSAISTSTPFASAAVSLPQTLASGQSLTIPVTFTPTAPAAVSNSLAFTTSAGLIGFDLHGQGTQDGLVASPAGLAFGSVPTSGTVTSTVNLTNSGTTTTTITGVTAPSAPFSVVPPAVGSTLAPGASVSVPVTFAPTTTGSMQSQLVVTSSTGAITLPVSGTGVSGFSQLTITPVDIDFGGIPLGTTTTKSFDISNTGNLLLTLTKAAPPAAPFLVPTPVSEGQQLEPADTIRQNVTFAPTSWGPVSGTYVISGNDGTGAKLVTLHGYGGVPTGLHGPALGPVGTCLDVRNADSADGTPAQVSPCNGTSAQLWTVTPSNTVMAMGKCLDVSGGGTTNGSRVQVWTCNGTGAQAWVPTVAGSLLNPQSGRCVDAPGGNTATGTVLQLYDCNGSGAQRWQPTATVAAATPPSPTVGPSGSCLDLQGGNGADGAVVQVWTCNGTGAQAWSLTSSEQLLALGKCLDVQGGGTADGSRVQLWSCNGSGAQVWYPSITGSLVNPQSGRCLDTVGGATLGSRLELRACDGTPAQRWQPTVNERAASVASPVFGPTSACLDLRGGASVDGTVVQFWPCNDTAAQSWTVNADRSIQALGKCLDISAGGTANGTRVQLWTCNGSGAQAWLPTVSGTLYNPQSGRCLDLPGALTVSGSALQLYDCNGSFAQRWQPGTL